jgi:hypothetical protein
MFNQRCQLVFLFSLHPSSRSQRHRCLRDRAPMIEVSSAETARPSCSQGRAPEPLCPCDLLLHRPRVPADSRSFPLILLYNITAPPVISFSPFRFLFRPNPFRFLSRPNPCTRTTRTPRTQHPYKVRAKTLRPQHDLLLAICFL